MTGSLPLPCVGLNVDAAFSQPRLGRRQTTAPCSSLGSFWLADASQVVTAVTGPVACPEISLLPAADFTTHPCTSKT